MEKIIRILLCEDVELLNDGLTSTLSKEKDLEVVSSIFDAEDIIPTLKEKDVDIVLTDIITKNNHNALDYIPAVKKEFPNVKVVVITSFPDISFIDKAKKVGANSFIYKNASTKELVNLIRNTSSGYIIYPNQERTNAELLRSLTPTEMKVLRLYCAGNDRTEIAKELSTSVSSVKNHISSILEKTGFRTLVKLAIYVIKEGLILPE
ncbi:MAG: response regulator transcription factor [Bacilli bacterium]|nr:response regulator transcription factor [Bacilli bacterium]